METTAALTSTEVAVARLCHSVGLTPTTGLIRGALQYAQQHQARWLVSWLAHTPPGEDCLLLQFAHWQREHIWQREKWGVADLTFSGLTRRML